MANTFKAETRKVYTKVNLVQRKSVRHLIIGRSICHRVHHVGIEWFKL